VSHGTEGIAHFDVTRIALIEALGNLPLGEYLDHAAKARMADALLGQMPPASDAAFYAEGVKAERQRVTELARRKRAVYCKPCDGAPCSYDDELAPFADVIREQP
jgi:hypothetical protein